MEKKNLERYEIHPSDVGFMKLGKWNWYYHGTILLTGVTCKKIHGKSLLKSVCL